MRLFILAIVAGIGVLVGVALYVGQECVNPGTHNSKIAALAEEKDSADADMAALAESEALDAKDESIDAKDEPLDKAYKNQLREASFPAGTTSFDSVALRKQLPEIFQFPEQPLPQVPQVSIASTTVVNNIPTTNNVPNVKAAAEVSNVPAAPPSTMPSIVADAPASDLTTDIRPDSPMIKHLIAPEHKPSVSTATNPNVQVEVAPASEGRAARSRMIVSR